VLGRVSVGLTLSRDSATIGPVGSDSQLQVLGGDPVFFLGLREAGWCHYGGFEFGCSDP
jgi:hypothetical protein